MISDIIFICKNEFKILIESFCLKNEVLIRNIKKVMKYYDLMLHILKYMIMEWINIKIKMNSNVQNIE